MENRKLIKNAIEFIQKHPKENLSLQSIADNAGFSLTYFDALFRKHTGYSPVEYARIYKLTRAALELRRTDKTVLDIAIAFGYESPESFTRAFKTFYSLPPSEYREKYSNEAITWKELSGKIAVNRFKRSFSQFKESDIEAALDYCFTHNPQKHAEDMVGITVAETQILTLGDTKELEHFVYVSDYNQAEPSVTLVCDNEEDAIRYLNILAAPINPHFDIRKSVNDVWEKFDAAAAHLGLTCQYAYDMLYMQAALKSSHYDGLTVRELTINDMTRLETFQQNGGCDICHVNAIRICLERRGNIGMRPIGFFSDDRMICLAMPTLDKVREMSKYDIGAMFALNDPNSGKAVENVWKFAIDIAQKDGAMLGNSNAKEEEGPLGVKYCETMGFEKVAQYCRYSK